MFVLYVPEEKGRAVHTVKYLTLTRVLLMNRFPIVTSKSIFFLVLYVLFLDFDYYVCVSVCVFLASEWVF